MPADGKPPSNSVRAQTGRAVRRAACGLCCFGISCGEPSAEPPLPEPSAGYPETTSRLTLSLGGDYSKLCHATLVDARWVVTAAHCFSLIDPDARGALNDFGLSISVRDVIFHPEALEDGSTGLDRIRETQEFVAAHDLALVPFYPAFEQVEPVSRWLPSEACSLSEPTRGRELGVRARFGKLGPDDEAQTAEATLIGNVSADELLGPEHSGVLLSARGSSVGPGDSGSGVTSLGSELARFTSGCVTSPSTGTGGDRFEVLMGVIQDANPDDPTLPFGSVPLYAFDHAQWLATIIETAPTPEPLEPPLLNRDSSPP